MPNGKQVAVAELGTLDPDTFTETIPLARIIELRNKKLTYDQIGKILGCTRQNIHERLKGLIPHIEGLQSFKDNDADVMTVLRSVILTSLTPEDIKKASAYQRVGMYGILYDKEALARGKVTEIIGYIDMNVAFAQVVAERAKLAKELGIIDVKPVPQDEQ